MNRVPQKPTNWDQIELFASRVRRTCLELAFSKNPRPVHFGGALSIVDILSVLYRGVMNYDIKNMLSQERDRFFLSKGHGVLGYYSVLHHAGFISREDLFTYGENATLFPGHPLINKSKGIEFTNGSLGMGLAVGIGNAIAAKRQGKNFKTFVLVGDGECNEGSVWEGVMAASHFSLDNITLVVDRNSLQQTGNCGDIMGLGDLSKKFEIFGWKTECVDGHDISALFQALTSREEGRPKAIVANTIKGKGFSFSEGNNTFHHAVITRQLYETGLRECSSDD